MTSLWSGLAENQYIVQVWNGHNSPEARFTKYLLKGKLDINVTDFFLHTWHRVCIFQAQNKSSKIFRRVIQVDVRYWG